MDKLANIRSFVATAEVGSLSGAARKLSITPSAVSKGLSRLEQSLGVRLLDRSTRKARLTEEGATYYERCVSILRDIEAADREISERRGTARGVLRVNSSVPFAHYCLAPLLPAFLARHPEVSLDLNVNDNIIDLFDNQADVAIRVGPMADSAMQVRKLGGIRRAIVASPGYLDRCGVPSTPADLEGHNCLNFNLGERLNTWGFSEVGEVRVRGRVRVNCGDTLRHLVLAGVGLARLGRFLVRDDLEAGRLVAVLEDHLDEPLEPVHAVFLGDGPLPSRVRVFVDFLAEHVVI
ncbi:MAG: LysR substrate-binding domain-containing protein [Bradymonadia bacterium]